jgi:hypothetical protein
MNAELGTKRESIKTMFIISRYGFIDDLSKPAITTTFVPQLVCGGEDERP